MKLDKFIMDSLSLDDMKAIKAGSGTCWSGSATCQSDTGDADDGSSDSDAD